MIRLAVGHCCFLSSLDLFFPSGAELKLDTRLADIQCQQGTVVATAESGYRDTFDMVILTIPATQVLQLGGINDITGNLDPCLCSLLVIICPNDMSQTLTL